MTKNVAMTHVGDGIRVNSVHPGYIDTPLTQVQPTEVNQLMIDTTPMHRCGQPMEVAYGCLYLASDESSFVTGAEMVIDGGTWPSDHDIGRLGRAALTGAVGRDVAGWFGWGVSVNIFTSCPRAGPAEYWRVARLPRQ